MRNIRRSSKYDGVVKQLCAYQSAELGRSAFQNYRELYVFAALLGFEMKREAETDKDQTELDSRPFSSDDPTLEAMLSLAIAATKNRELLLSKNEEQVVEVFERFLNGGLEVIAGWCAEKPTDDSGIDAIIGGMADARLIPLDNKVIDGGVKF